MPRYQVTDKDTNEVLYVMPDEQSCQKQVCISAKANRATELHFYLAKQSIAAHVVTSKGDYNYIIEPYAKPLKEPTLRVQPKLINPANPLAWRGKPSQDGWMKVTVHTEGEPSLEFLERKVSDATKKMGLRLMTIKPAPWHFHCITVPLDGGDPIYTDIGDLAACNPASGVRGASVSVVDTAKTKAPSVSQPSAQYLVMRKPANQFWYIAYKRYIGLHF